MFNVLDAEGPFLEWLDTADVNELKRQLMVYEDNLTTLWDNQDFKLARNRYAVHDGYINRMRCISERLDEISV